MQKTRFLLIAALLVWVGFIFSAFYIVQKPLAIQVGIGIFSLLRTMAVTGLIILEAAGLGAGFLRRLVPTLDAGERIFLGTGLGLGGFGILGFALVAARIPTPLAYSIILIGLAILEVVSGLLGRLKADILVLWQELRTPPGPGLKWVPWAAGLGGLLTFLLALAPPAEAFDALLYHLAIPAAWLKDGGLVFSQNIPTYWFPGLAEGTYVWGLALGSETVAALLHLTWGGLAIGLIWWWAKKAWNLSLAWRSVAVLLSMPSLFLLASWAYTDMALIFYTAAALYVLWLLPNLKDTQGAVLAGLFCGLAMGVKYTSFILPIMVLGWLVFTYRRRFQDMVLAGFRFVIPTFLVAFPWYLRNWIWTGNPIYPFLFGGKSWDPFLTAHYAQSGTGIGLDITQLFLLPLNITLGTHDVTYYSGRIGPLWLILLPASLWVIWHTRKETMRSSLLIPIVFGLVSIGTWTIGVINSSALWQSRMLFSALIPLAPLAALSWEALGQLDTPRFHFSFIFNTLATICILITLLDFGLFGLARNPLAAALGIIPRKDYFAQYQPNYADALSLIAQTPTDSRIYFLYEPRSYGMPRTVSPDPLNTNLAHNLYLYHSPESVIAQWRLEGYSYVLYQHAGDGLLENPAEDAELFSLLNVAAETSNTILYKIPSP